VVDFKNRSDVIAVLARAAHRGSLGLFLGTGFSIAVTKRAAPNWKTLLVKIAKGEGFPDPFADLSNVGVSMPEIASGFVRMRADALADDNRYLTLTPGQRLGMAKLSIKEAAARCVAPLQPDQVELDDFQRLFHAIKPAWVVTTNYDDLFQKIHGKTRTFLPNDVIVQTDGLVPVWHIHGTVVVPRSMVLTHEDYVEHLRPATYRQSKLAHMMAECTTLMLGYGYGDVNVQTASMIAHSTGLLDLATSRRPGDSLVVHVARQGKVSQEVKRGPVGSISIEADEIKTLLGEILTGVKDLRGRMKTAGKLFEMLKTDPGALARNVMRDSSNLEKFTKIIRDFPSAYYDFDVISALGQLFSEVSKKAYERGGFSYYGDWLNYVLRMLLEWDLADMPPSIFDLLAGQLAEVVYFVDPDGKHTFGTSWVATDAWRNNKELLAKRPNLLEALDAYSRRSTGGSILGELLQQVRQ
jgi:hypothetical protein